MKTPFLLEYLPQGTAILKLAGVEPLPTTPPENPWLTRLKVTGAVGLGLGTGYLAGTGLEKILREKQLLSSKYLPLAVAALGAAGTYATAAYKRHADQEVARVQGQPDRPAGGVPAK